jgi:hypothetical protein
LSAIESTSLRDPPISSLHPRGRRLAPRFDGHDRRSDPERLRLGRRELLVAQRARGVQLGQVFDLIRRIRAEGLTVLIVEQNVQQVLEVVDRAYLLEVGSIRLSGTSTELKNNEFIRKAYMGL